MFGPYYRKDYTRLAVLKPTPLIFDQTVMEGSVVETNLLDSEKYQLVRKI